ncbi:hypothetical protein HMPREF3293_02037 [Christensenella minuta]|uniref:Uncharacterized protein n=1 Tax=Christensenella minuta TaxID=626937 RepID=A0A136Q2Q4_9FIRM|nr:hypothetical protein HMPREF3293_02037 [Christensenella minuta]
MQTYQCLLENSFKLNFFILSKKNSLRNMRPQKNFLTRTGKTMLDSSAKQCYAIHETKQCFVIRRAKSCRAAGQMPLLGKCLCWVNASPGKCLPGTALPQHYSTIGLRRHDVQQYFGTPQHLKHTAILQRHNAPRNDPAAEQECKGAERSERTL